MKRRCIYMLLALTSASTLFAGNPACLNAPDELVRDTTKTLQIEEVVIVATPKDNFFLFQQPLSSTLFSGKELEEQQVDRLRHLTALAPNLYIPSYGSRLTSALYIRGIGSRMNSSAVGLYVDNIPYLNKSAFDIDLLNVKRIDVLRGPQGTLYGRNTMGGLIRVYTQDPLTASFKAAVGSSFADSTTYANISINLPVNKHLGFSGSFVSKDTRGYFYNASTQQYADRNNSNSTRLRALWVPTSRWGLDLTTSYAHSKEGGYAYGAYNRTTHQTAAVNYNHPSSYKRDLLQVGLNITHIYNHQQLSLISSYQHLNDHLALDQDFSPADLFEMKQRQRINSYTQEITLRSNKNRLWQYSHGLFASYQNQHTSAPTSFGSDGVQMLTSGINHSMPNLSAQKMAMKVNIEDATLRFPGTFATPNYSLALFHESTIHNLFNTPLTLTVGARLEYMHHELHYNTNNEMQYSFTLSSPMMPLILPSQTLNSQLEGNLSTHQWQFLPKIALHYFFTTRNNLYFSLSKGHRSGGYNIQLFSDLLTQQLQQGMTQQIVSGTNQKLDQLAQKGMPSFMVNRIKGYMQAIPSPAAPDVAATIGYAPEESWNYELGSHLALFQEKLLADISLFYLRTKNQQITRFSTNGLGRMMVNAGKSESYGLEVSMRSQITRSWQAHLTYGYTHARFVTYNDGRADYADKSVPMSPSHTLNVGSSYTFHSRNRHLNALTLSASYSGIGKLYWNENNTLSQPYYGRYNCSIRKGYGAFYINMWCKNLFNKSYNTFCFENRGQDYAQQALPRQIGFDLQMNF